MSRVGIKLVDSLAPRIGYAYIRLLKWTMRCAAVPSLRVTAVNITTMALSRPVRLAR